MNRQANFIGLYSSIIFCSSSPSSSTHSASSTCTSFNFLALCFLYLRKRAVPTVYYIRLCWPLGAS